MDAIRNDPQWMNGDYSSEPVAALRTAAGLLLIAGSAPIQMQLSLPSQAAADEFLQKYMAREMDDLDANDLLYAVNASRDYDPSAGFEKIKAPLLLINSGDDFINPPELGIAEREIKRVANGRFVLLPASDQTHGHGRTPGPRYGRSIWRNCWMHRPRLPQRRRPQSSDQLRGIRRC